MTPRQALDDGSSQKYKPANQSKGVRNPATLNSPTVCTELEPSTLSEIAWQEIASSLRLSARELQIVRAVFNDRKEYAIAIDLGISPKTVHTYFERLHHKLSVTDRVQLVLRIFTEYVKLTETDGSKLPPICAHRAAGRCKRKL